MRIWWRGDGEAQGVADLAGGGLGRSQEERQDREAGRVGRGPAGRAQRAGGEVPGGGAEDVPAGGGVRIRVVELPEPAGRGVHHEQVVVAVGLRRRPVDAPLHERRRRDGEGRVGCGVGGAGRDDRPRGPRLGAVALRQRIPAQAAAAAVGGEVADLRPGERGAVHHVVRDAPVLAAGLVLAPPHVEVEAVRADGGQEGGRAGVDRQRVDGGVEEVVGGEEGAAAQRRRGGRPAGVRLVAQEAGVAGAAAAGGEAGAVAGAGDAMAEVGGRLDRRGGAAVAGGERQGGREERQGQGAPGRKAEHTASVPPPSVA